MWMLRQLIHAEKPEAAVKISQTAADGKVVQAYSGKVQVCGPWGIEWKPPQNTQAVTLPTDSELLCMGCAAAQSDLQPGELRLFSAGGAEIRLKNSGEVIINGQAFPAQKG